MDKIFRYECGRLMGNKFFLGLLAILLFYGWQVLDHVTVLGVSHTAPFSPWSYGDYLSRMLPLLWMGALFFLTFYFSRAEEKRAVLTAASPADPFRYGLARWSAALMGTALLSLAAVGLAAVYFEGMFGWHDWGSLILPTLLTLIPPLVFALGSGWALGRVRPWLIYGWMAFPFGLRLLPLPDLLGMLNGSLFSERPLALETLDPAFSLPAEVFVAQAALLFAGAALFLKTAGPVRRGKG